MWDMKRNLGYRLLSLCIGIMLYAVAFTQNNPRTTREMFITPEAIELRDIPADMVVRTAPSGVQVTVQGQIAAIESFRAQPIKAYIDLSRASKGKYRTPLKFKTDNLAVDIIAPAYVEVDITRKTRVAFRVDTLYNNTPPPGYVYAEPTTSPPTVQVTGLESEVRKVDRVVAFMDNGVTSNSLTQTVTLVAQTVKQESVDTVEIAPARVTVTLLAQKAPATKFLVLSARLEGVPAPGYALTSYMFDPPTINASGTQAVLTKLSAITVPLNISGLSQSETKSVVVPLPEGVMRAGQGSNRVSVHLEIQRTQTTPSPEASAVTIPQASGTPKPLLSPAVSPTPAQVNPVPTP